MATYKCSKKSTISTGPTRPNITFKLKCEPEEVVEVEKECEKRVRIGRGRREASRPHVFCRNDGLVIETPQPKKDPEKCCKKERGAREPTRPTVFCRNDGQKEVVENKAEKCCKKSRGIREPTRPQVFCRNDGQVEEVVEDKQECCKPTAPKRRRKKLTFCRNDGKVEETPKKECPTNARTTRAKPPVPKNLCKTEVVKDDCCC